jgi:hypothetical protein
MIACDKNQNELVWVILDRFFPGYAIESLNDNSPCPAAFLAPFPAKSGGISSAITDEAALHRLTGIPPCAAGLTLFEFRCYC